MIDLKNKLRLTWLRGLSFIFQAVGDDEKALFYLNNLTLGGETADSDWWALGRIYSRRREWDKASQALQNAVRTSSGNPKYLFWLGKVEEETGNMDEAEALYGEALKNNGRYWQALAAKGELILARGEYESALPYFQECLNIRPADHRMLNNAGLCYLSLEDAQTALKYIGDAVGRKNDDPTYLFNLGMVYVKLKRYHDAVAVLNKTGLKDNINLLIALAYCYGSLEEYDQSIQCYREALNYDRENSEIYKNMAVIYAKKGSYNEALDILKKIIVINSGDAEILNSMAWIQEELEDLEEAQENYYRSLACSAGNPQIAYNLICCLNKQKKYLEAMEIVAHLRRYPEWQGMAWSSLARIYECLGANNLAVDCYNKALGLE